MRQRKLAAFARHQLGIWDWRTLQSLCGFRPDYLFAGDPPVFHDTADEFDCEPGEFPLTPAKRGDLMPEQKELFQG